MKKILSVVLCVSLLLVLAIPVSAAEQYTYIDTLQCSLSIDNTWGIATCSGSVTSIDGVDMEIEVRLRKYGDNGWETLKTWSNRDTYTVGAGGQYAVAHGYQYQTYVTAYIYDENGRIVESDTISDSRYY